MKSASEARRLMRVKDTDEGFRLSIDFVASMMTIMLRNHLPDKEGGASLLEVRQEEVLAAQVKS